MKQRNMGWTGLALAIGLAALPAVAQFPGRGAAAFPGAGAPRGGGVLG